MTGPAILPTIEVVGTTEYVPRVRITETTAPVLRAPTVPLVLQGAPAPAPINWWLLGLAAVGLWLVLSGRAGQRRGSW